MTIHSLITLSADEAIRVSPAGTHSGCDITIQNVDDTAYVYVGAEGVSSSNYGYRIAPGTAISFELPGKNALYAISGTNGYQIAILETRLEVGH